MLAQLVGRKRMLLWPPLALPELHLYPATHTAFRQSQVPLGAAAAAAAQPPGSPAARAMATLPGFASAGLHAAVGVDLEPGDCVYIPPYWGHGVYSVEPSVSLASFSNSWEQARWATISSLSPLYLTSISHVPPLYLPSMLRRAGPARDGSPRRSAASRTRRATACVAACWCCSLSFAPWLPRSASARVPSSRRWCE